jgi:hypothetical protein
MSGNSVLSAITRVIFGIAIGLPVLSETALATNPPIPILVELFTSEGCSSCPPADALLRTFDRSQPFPGVQLIVLSEHVDYWDDLGWRDPFSSHLFTQRQAAYANQLRLATSYTPQMVVDGEIQFVGSDHSRAAQAFEKARSAEKVNLRISGVAVENGKLHAHIDSDPLPEKAELFVALALDRAQSQVLRGENGGHRLEHVAVVRNLISLGNAAMGSLVAKEATFKLDSSMPHYRLVAFLQQPNQRKIVGAAVASVEK